VTRRAAQRVAARGLAGAALLFAAGAVAQDAPRLALPVACELGRTCFVQHYADVDGSGGVSDHACGAATYDGHNGIDFRLLSAAQARGGVGVLAAADGTVLRVRDGVADAFARERGRTAIGDRECGNGVILQHAGGLETQYCHLLEGSVAVRPGQAVRVGEALGRVGYSGLADFAHLHFVVRRDGRELDPYTGLGTGKAASLSGACRAADATRGLWSAAMARDGAYRPADIIQVGFSEVIPQWQALERDHDAAPIVRSDSPQLVFYVRAIKLAAGDRLRIEINGPSGFRVAHTTAPLERAQAIRVVGAGKRLTTARWAAGRYEAEAGVVRGDTVIAKAAGTLTLP